MRFLHRKFEWFLRMMDYQNYLNYLWDRNRL